MKWSATIIGQCVSMKNRRRIWVRKGTGKPFSAKSADATQYMKDVRMQLEFLRPRKLLEGPLRFSGVIYYRSGRSDLDPGALMDVMQGFVYADDNQIHEFGSLRKAIDKLNPRAEIVIEEV